MFKRIGLFLLVNILIIAIISIVTSTLGLNTRYLEPAGINYQALITFCLLWGFVGSFISLLLAKPMAKWMMKVKIIEQPQGGEEQFLFDVIKRISENIGIKMPQIGIYQSGEVNAFATGATRNSSLVAVSSGLLQEMNHDEIEGVLAHEMAHIANGDMVTMTLLQGVINAFVMFFARVAAFAVQRAMGREEIGGIAYFVTMIVFEIFFSILASLVVMKFSRWREYGADLGGAKYSTKGKMIAALQKLESLQSRVDTSQKSFATMKISDKPAGMWRLWASHPPLQDRIMALQKAMVA